VYTVHNLALSKQRKRPRLPRTLVCVKRRRSQQTEYRSTRSTVIILTLSPSPQIWLPTNVARKRLIVIHFVLDISGWTVVNMARFFFKKSLKNLNWQMSFRLFIVISINQKQHSVNEVPTWWRAVRPSSFDASGLVPSCSSLRTETHITHRQSIYVLLRFTLNTVEKQLKCPQLKCRLNSVCLTQKMWMNDAQAAASHLSIKH